MSRIRIPYDDLPRQAAWVAETLASAFTVPTRMPTLVKRPTPPEPEASPTLLDLLDALPPRAVEAADEVPCASPRLRQLMMRSGALPPVSKLAMKRRQLKAEREAAIRTSSATSRE